MTIITVLKKGQNLGDNDVEMPFLSQRKESTRPTEQITHFTEKYRRVNYFDFDERGFD